MNQSNNLYRDIFTKLTFTAGMILFMSGEFILSAMLFCMASIAGQTFLGGLIKRDEVIVVLRALRIINQASEWTPLP